MKYPNSQKGLFRGSVYYAGGEQQQNIGAYLLLLSSSFEASLIFIKTNFSAMGFPRKYTFI